MGGFTPCLQRQLQLPGRLVPSPSEIHGRSLSLLFGPSLPASARVGHRGQLLRPLLTSRSASRRRPLGRKARSPQVRVMDLPDTTAGFTRPPFGRGSFAVACPLAPGVLASYPVPVRQRVGSLPASFSAVLAADALRFALGSLQPAPPEDLHLLAMPMLGAQTEPAQISFIHAGSWLPFRLNRSVS